MAAAMRQMAPFVVVVGGEAAHRAEGAVAPPARLVDMAVAVERRLEFVAVTGIALRHAGTPGKLETDGG